MFGALWNRGANLSPLEADLRKITDSESIDVPPKDIVTSITQASYDADSRREIMGHLQECMAESGGRRWRRIYGGLVLLEELLRRGSPLVPKEIGQGLHFDPIQRLTFLERFEYQEDRRVQNMMRQKATALRANLIARMDGEVPDSPSAGSAGSRKGRQSPNGSSSPVGGRFEGFGSDGPGRPGSPAGGNSRFKGFGSDGPGQPYDSRDPDAMPYNPAFPGFGSDCMPQQVSESLANKSRAVNGLVKMGHRDDTDSESSGDDRKGRTEQAQRREEQHAPRDRRPQAQYERRRAMEDSTDSDSSSSSSRRRREKRKQRSAVHSRPKAAHSPEPAPAKEAVLSDLLGGDEAPAKPAVAAPAAAAACQEDLLGGLLDAAPVAATPTAPAVAASPQANDANLLDF